MQNDNEILESLILGGFIGATLGALITNSKEGAGIGSIAGAAILATYKANVESKKSSVAMCFEENGNLYEMKSGQKKFLRKIDKPTQKLEKRFKLE
jgi:hypothetical protein